MTNLQQQAWDSVSPTSVLLELKTKYTIEATADTIKVTPKPNDRLCYQIKRYKSKLLELLGVGKTTRQRVDEAWKSKGIDPDTYQAQERQALQTEDDFKGPITFPMPQESPAVEPPWDSPVIIRVKQDYCQHQAATHYRVKEDHGIVVKLLCPDCGRNMRGPRRFSEAKKRSTVPWWPVGSKVTPDPDAETDALVEWWNNIEHNIVDGMTLSRGVVVGDAVAYRRSMTELIALWKFGDPDHGLKAQLKAHKKHMEAV